MIKILGEIGKVGGRAEWGKADTMRQRWWRWADCGSNGVVGEQVEFRKKASLVVAAKSCFPSWNKFQLLLVSRRKCHA